MGDAACQKFPRSHFFSARPDRRKRGVTSLLLSALRESCCPSARLSLTNRVPTSLPPLLSPAPNPVPKTLCHSGHPPPPPLLPRLEDQAIPPLRIQTLSSPFFAGKKGGGGRKITTLGLFFFFARMATAKEKEEEEEDEEEDPLAVGICQASLPPFFVSDSNAAEMTTT